jgi:hypothetical protein
MVLTVDEARIIVETLYEGVNRLATVNIAALFEQCMHPDLRQ